MACGGEERADVSMSPTSSTGGETTGGSDEPPPASTGDDATTSEPADADDSTTGPGSTTSSGTDSGTDDPPGTGTTSGTGLDPDAPPGDNFDLAHWKITFPDSSEESQQWLIDGNERPGEFFTDPQTGGMVFRCPNHGESTSGSTYARSELREMLREPGSDVPTQGINANNWVTSTSSAQSVRDAGGVDGRLEATLTVDHVSTTFDDGQEYMVGRVIVGQIHGPDDEPCKIYYRQLPGHTKGSVYFTYEPEEGNDIVYPLVGSPDTDAEEPQDGIALGEPWSYSIVVEGSDLTVTIEREDGTEHEASHVMEAYYDDAWLYFKAGVYNQNRGGDEDDYVQATFFSLTHTHD